MFVGLIYISFDRFREKVTISALVALFISLGAVTTALTPDEVQSDRLWLLAPAMVAALFAVFSVFIAGILAMSWVVFKFLDYASNQAEALFHKLQQEWSR